MKNIVLFLALVVSVLVFSPKALAVELVEVCHKQGDSFSTIEVNPNALAGHLGHGDFEGPCEVAEVPEFGLVTGMLAAAGSAVSYGVMKKRTL